jgi:hypothetical protein
MDNEGGAVVIEDVYGLGVSSIVGLTDDQAFAVTDDFGVRGMCMVNDIFGVGYRHSMIGDVLFVPIIPPILHLE